MISRLIEKDMLAKINFDNVPNQKYIMPEFRNLNFDPSNEYSVPYVWGMVGIFYNKNEVKDDINWNVLWNPKYSGRILMFDNARDAFGISLLRLGYSINTKDEKQLREAADELIKQKPLVQAYVMDQIFDKMANGEAALAPYYAGDAVSIVKNNSDIGFVIPDSGTERFVECMCIPKNSRHKELAEKYINFMCRSDIALANTKKTGYSTPHTEVYKMLDDDVKNNEIFYPNEVTIKNSQVFVNLPEETNKLMDELWIEVKSGGASEARWSLVAIVLGFGMIYVGVVLWKEFKRKK